MSVPATQEQTGINRPIDLGIPTSGSKWDNQIKREVGILFLLYGNTQRISELSGIPKGTICCWKQTEWWDKLINQLQTENKDEINGNLTRLVMKSSKVIENQLDRGEVKARDAATIMGISFDKRQILNNQATQITGKASGINDLQKEFERYLKAKEIDVSAVIEESTD
jgi:hypothetical protein